MAACQALNSFAELLFNENEQDDADDDADIASLRRQMDAMNDASIVEEDSNNNAPSPAVTIANTANTSNNRTDIPTELTIEMPLNDNHNENQHHNQAAEEAIMACRSADDVDNAVDDNGGNKSKEKKIALITGDDIDADADACTVETSPLDVTQDISDSSLTIGEESAASSSDSSYSNGSSTGGDIASAKKTKTSNVERSRSYVSSLQNLTANLSSKATQLRELDTLVSWQSRRTCKLSDPVASANFDESIEVTRVDITLASPEQQAWSENYAKLADQYRQHGSSIAHLTQSRTSKPNVEYYKMRMFIDQQRKAAKKGMLTKQQIVQLVALGMDFDNNADDGDDAKDGDVVIKEEKESADSTTNPTANDDNDDVQQEDVDDDIKEVSQCASF